MGGLGPPNDDRLSPLLCKVGSGSVFFFFHRDPRVTLVQRGYLIGSLIVCLLHCLSAITPFFGQKRSPGGGQNCFWAIFVNRPIKPLGKIFQTQKNRFKKSFFFSELQEHEVRICVQTNFPIIIPILFNGFHEFAKSIGPTEHQWFSTCGQNEDVFGFFFSKWDGAKIGKVENKREIFLNLGM